MYRDKDPDFNVPDGHSWFYPLSSEEDSEPTLKNLSFGKCWHAKEENNGPPKHEKNQFHVLGRRVHYIATCNPRRRDALQCVHDFLQRDRVCRCHSSNDQC